MAAAPWNLDDQFLFCDGWLVLTNSRLLAFRAPVDSTDAREARLESALALGEITDLPVTLRGGIGSVEALGASKRLGCWHFTAKHFPEAEELRAALERRGQAVSDEPSENGPSEGAKPELGSDCSPAPKARSLFRLYRFARPHTAMILLGLFLTLATTASGLVAPYLTMPLLDDILIPYQTAVEEARGRTDLAPRARAALVREVREENSKRFTLAKWYLLGLAGSAVAAWILGWGQGVVMAWVSERISADLRNATYEHLQSLSLEYFGGKRTGDLMTRISSDTDRICTFLSDNLVDFGTDVLMIVGTTAILISIDPVLAVATLVPFPIIGWMIYWARDRLQVGFARSGRAWSNMTSVLADTIPGIRVVKAFAQESREIERFRRGNRAIVEANDRVNTLWAFFWPAVVLLNQVGLLVVWIFGIWRVQDERITVGVLTAFLAYIGRFYTRLESMSRMFSATQRAAASAQRVFEVLDRVPSVAEPAKPISARSLRGRIEFRSVSFRYGNRAVLSDINLAIRPGEMIGLVGPSGAGKSTLVNLVLRFYDASSGSVLVDGVDVRAYGLADYRRHVGVVLQDPFLFYGTIAENIAYGRPNASRAEILAAARAARAHEFILRLPDGYDSMVGERGQTLSGGERQRISIARALLINPRILILDEATSSVDTETEHEIQQALDNLVQGRTTIAIAHRLSTVRRADRLVVLDQGRIAQMGVHEELLEREGIYSRLHQAQLVAAREIAV